jgi:hypothetical protein
VLDSLGLYLSSFLAFVAYQCGNKNGSLWVTLFSTSLILFPVGTYNESLSHTEKLFDCSAREYSLLRVHFFYCVFSSTQTFDADCYIVLHVPPWLYFAMEALLWTQ